MRRMTLALAFAALAASPRAATGTPAEPAVTGGWTLNRDLTPVPDASRVGRGEGGRSSGGGYGGHGGHGGQGGHGGFGGRGGMGGSGGMEGRRPPSDNDKHAMDVVRRRITEIPDHLVITRDGSRLSITDGEGRQTTLAADGKKQPRVTGDGEFKSTTRFEGARLVIEEDFGGFKIVTTYTPTLDDAGRARLEVKVKANRSGSGSGGSGEGRGGPPEVTRVYDADQTRTLQP